MTTTPAGSGIPKLGLTLPEGEHDSDGRTARWVDYAEIVRTAEVMGPRRLCFEAGWQEARALDA